MKKYTWKYQAVFCLIALFLWYSFAFCDSVCNYPSSDLLHCRSDDSHRFHGNWVKEVRLCCKWSISLTLLICRWMRWCLIATCWEAFERPASSVPWSATVVPRLSGCNCKWGSSMASFFKAWSSLYVMHHNSFFLATGIKVSFKTSVSTARIKLAFPPQEIHLFPYKKMVLVPYRWLRTNLSIFPYILHAVCLDKK